MKTKCIIPSRGRPTARRMVLFTEALVASLMWLAASQGLQALPTITMQPTNSTACAGGTATFCVEAQSELPLAYQWRIYRTSIDFTNLPGETSACVTLTDLPATGSPPRPAVVVSDASGSVTSRIAALRIGVAPFHYGTNTTGGDDNLTGGTVLADMRGISLDGAGWSNAPDLLAPGLQKPSLMMNRPDNFDEVLFSKAAANAFWFQISDSMHVDFGDGSWYPDPVRLASGLETSRIIHDYQLSFLNKYLKGRDDHLLDGPPGALFPRVVGFKKK